jgi:hypothetical protein
MKPRFFLRVAALFLALGMTWAAVLGDDALPDADYYLSARSEDGSAAFGEFFPFKDRFVQSAQGRIYDRFLKVTWLAPPDPNEPNALSRMDWDAAQRLAVKLKARLPSLNELKTLVTKRSAPAARAFIDRRFFPLSSHTRKCWSSDSSSLWGPWKPYHRAYVDFAQAAWDTTSMSEMYCVLLISTE